MKEAFSQITSARYKAVDDVLSYSAVIRAKNCRGQFNVNVDLDEIKYFYSELSPAGK